MKHWPKALILIASLLPTSAVLADTPLFSADGYRLSHYRSPTPLTHEHARTLDTVALQQLLMGARRHDGVPHRDVHGLERHVDRGGA